MKTSQIRKAFLTFFKNKNHTILSAAPVILKNDPTLLFVNAGMNQFKDVFLGKGTRPYQRAANAQICVRVSGKHNDLEEVGFDGTHLTSFEMLGNWSFGDYEKPETISWAWAFLTTDLKIPKEKLYATIHDNDPESGQIWKEETDIDPTHILTFSDQDNFWEMGQTGPCGPCTEIHIDLDDMAKNPVDVMDPVHGVNGTSGRFVELWNLVFIQYNRKEDQSLEPLDQLHVDTGAGLERIAAYLQNKKSVYDIDNIKPIIKKIEKITNKAYQENQEGAPHRVLTDHSRTLTMAIADNVLPSNEGRGYVLRRLLRRAANYARKLDCHEPIIYKLVPTIATKMKDYYPIKDRVPLIQEVIKTEEERFLKTLESGSAYFEKLTANQKKTLSGKEAFKLYDTYGFPLDLTQMMAKEKQISVDCEGFEKAMQAQKQRSQKATKAHQAVFKEKPGGGEARFVENEQERLQMARHHTATHLLQSALKKQLGNHVNQAGSLVDLTYLRFDFNHSKALKKEELDQLEQMINQNIKDNLKITIDSMPLKQAKEKGAISLFGEKYPEQVRVVSIEDISIELCGGNHVQKTRDIQSVQIIQETAVGAGIRRIEMIAGEKNIQAFIDKKKEQIINKIIKKQAQKKKGESPSLKNKQALMGLTQPELEKSYQKIVDQIKDQEKRKRKDQQKQAVMNINEIKKEIIKTKSHQLLIKCFDNQPIEFLRTLSDELMNQVPNLIAILASKTGLILIKVSKPLITKTCSAPLMLKELLEQTGGKGGGRPDMAQAGGADTQKIESGLKIMEQKWSDVS